MMAAIVEQAGSMDWDSVVNRVVIVLSALQTKPFKRGFDQVRQKVTSTGSHKIKS